MKTGLFLASLVVVGLFTAGYVTDFENMQTTIDRFFASSDTNATCSSKSKTATKACCKSKAQNVATTNVAGANVKAEGSCCKSKAKAQTIANTNAKAEGSCCKSKAKAQNVANTNTATVNTKAEGCCKSKAKAQNVANTNTATVNTKAEGCCKSKKTETVANAKAEGCRKSKAKAQNVANTAKAEGSCCKSKNTETVAKTDAATTVAPMTASVDNKVEETVAAKNDSCGTACGDKDASCSGCPQPDMSKPKSDKIVSVDGSCSAEGCEEWGNATCPVMPGKANQSQFATIYQGKKLYLCCQPCLDMFERNPEQYHEQLIAVSKK